jgi:hypothetical protein
MLGWTVSVATARTRGGMLLSLSNTELSTGGGMILTGAILVGWLVYPTALVTVVFPSDAIAFEYWMQGQPVPRIFTPQMLIAGEMTALTVLVGLSLFLLGTVVLFYRRVRFSVSIWPLAGVLVGLLGNGTWWVGTWHFDLLGALAGLTPLVITVGCELVCEEWGQDFVFGPGNRPRFYPGL